MNLIKKEQITFNTQQDIRIARRYLDEAIQWLYHHDEKQYKKIGIRPSTTGEDRICQVCKTLNPILFKKPKKEQTVIRSTPIGQISEPIIEEEIDR